MDAQSLYCDQSGRYADVLLLSLKRSTKRYIDGRKSKFQKKCKVQCVAFLNIWLSYLEVQVEANKI